MTKYCFQFGKQIKEHGQTNLILCNKKKTNLVYLYLKNIFTFERSGENNGLAVYALW